MHAQARVDEAAHSRRTRRCVLVPACAARRCTTCWRAAPALTQRAGATRGSLPPRLQRQSTRLLCVIYALCYVRNACCMPRQLPFCGAHLLPSLSVAPRRHHPCFLPHKRALGSAFCRPATPLKLAPFSPCPVTSVARAKGERPCVSFIQLTQGCCALLRAPSRPLLSLHLHASPRYPSGV